MKFISGAVILMIMFLGIVRVSAQQTETSVWTVDAIKTDAGQQANYLQFVGENWARARATLQKQGKIKSYRVLSVAPEKTQTWDVMLLTEYASREAFENREALFAEVFKTQKTVLVNGKTGREMSKIINVDAGYAEAVASVQTRAISDAELAAVKIPLQNYIDGQMTDEGDYFRRAFYKDARIIGYSASSKRFVNLSVEQFAGNYAGKNPKDPRTHRRIFEILEITGTAAVARVSSDLPKSKYSDYMSLQKIDGEWKIVNKSFYEELK